MQAHSRSRLLLGLVACFCLGLAHVISRSERAVQLQGLEDEEYMNNLDGAVGFGQRSLAITLQHHRRQFRLSQLVEQEAAGGKQGFLRFLTHWEAEHPDATADDKIIAWDAWQAASEGVVGSRHTARPHEFIGIPESRMVPGKGHGRILPERLSAGTIRPLHNNEDRVPGGSNTFDDELEIGDAAVKRSGQRKRHTDRSAAGAASFVDSHFKEMDEPALRPEGEKTPETIVAAPDGPPDFNGMDAILARHANLGAAPTDLHENKAESRGSFTIRMIRTGLDEDGEVALAIWGPNHPFKCTMRGYRKLSDDFQGNSVYTGFQQKWTGVRRIDTGYISPGVQGEYDIVTCRDGKTGETQYFRYEHGGLENNDLTSDPPVAVLGPHFGMNTDAVSFDMDRPTFEDYAASGAWYDGQYDPAADIKPFA